MKPIHGPLLYEGKAKKIFESEFISQVYVEFKDDATAFNALKRAELEGKGRLNCQISACFFEKLEKDGIPTHYQGLAGETWMRVDRVEIIPLEVVIRNLAAGSLCRETPLKHGEEINPPLLDFYYKDDSLSDPLLTSSRLKLLGLLNVDQQMEVEGIARAVNESLRPFCNDLDLTLVDFKLEFGVDSAGKILLADEISPDTCRFWDQKLSDPEECILDKDRFRKDLGGVLDAYREILKRVQAACPKPRYCK